MQRTTETQNTEKNKTRETNTKETKPATKAVQNHASKKLNLDLKSVKPPNGYQIRSDRPQNSGGLASPHSHLGKGSVSRLNEQITRTDHKDPQHMKSPSASIYSHNSINLPSPYNRTTPFKSDSIKTNKLETSIHQSLSPTPSLSQQPLVQRELLKTKEQREKEYMEYCQERQRQKALQEKLLKNFVISTQSPQVGSSNESILTTPKQTLSTEPPSTRNKVVIVKKINSLPQTKPANNSEHKPSIHSINAFNSQSKNTKFQTPSDLSNVDDRNQSKNLLKFDLISPNLKGPQRSQRKKNTKAIKWLNYNFKVWEMDTPAAQDPLGLHRVLNKNETSFERDQHNFKLLSDMLWQRENNHSKKHRVDERFEKLMEMDIRRDFEHTLNPPLKSKLPIVTINFI